MSSLPKQPAAITTNFCLSRGSTLRAVIGEEETKLTRDGKKSYSAECFSKQENEFDQQSILENSAIIKNGVKIDQKNNINV